METTKKCVVCGDEFKLVTGAKGRKPDKCPDCRDEKTREQKFYRKKLLEKKGNGKEIIEPYKKYRVCWDQEQRLGNLDTKQTWVLLSSGRQSGVILEEDISCLTQNTVSHEKQGDNPDLFILIADENGEQMKTIQAKTYRPSKEKKIYTTKSGIKDKSLPKEEVVETTKAYFDKYDYFCYIDIENFDYEQHYYTFIIVPIEEVKKILMDDHKHILTEDLKKLVKEGEKRLEKK